MALQFESRAAILRRVLGVGVCLLGSVACGDVVPTSFVTGATLAKCGDSGLSVFSLGKDGLLYRSIQVDKGWGSWEPFSHEKQQMTHIDAGCKGDVPVVYGTREDGIWSVTANAVTNAVWKEMDLPLDSSAIQWKYGLSVTSQGGVTKLVLAGAEAFYVISEVEGELQAERVIPRFVDLPQGNLHSLEQVISRPAADVDQYGGNGPTAVPGIAVTNSATHVTYRNNDKERNVLHVRMPESGVASVNLPVLTKNSEAALLGPRENQWSDGPRDMEPRTREGEESRCDVRAVSGAAVCAREERIAIFAFESSSSGQGSQLWRAWGPGANGSLEQGPALNASGQPLQMHVASAVNSGNSTDVEAPDCLWTRDAEGNEKIHLVTRGMDQKIRLMTWKPGAHQFDEFSILPTP